MRTVPSTSLACGVVLIPDCIDETTLHLQCITLTTRKQKVKGLDSTKPFPTTQIVPYLRGAMLFASDATSACDFILGGCAGYCETCHVVNGKKVGKLFLQRPVLLKHARTTEQRHHLDPPSSRIVLELCSSSRFWRGESAASVRSVCANRTFYRWIKISRLWCGAYPRLHR
jgi:hypothetical protein